MARELYTDAEKIRMFDAHEKRKVDTYIEFTDVLDKYEDLEEAGENIPAAEAHEDLQRLFTLIYA